MTIWILVSVMLLSLAALGYRQGAIRVSFSLIGIIVSALLAGPLAKYVQPMLPHVGIHDPTVIWLVSPLIRVLGFVDPVQVGGVFCASQGGSLFQIQRRQHPTDPWNRLNARLGLGLGLMNGLAYLVLISFIIFDLSYWTVQVATSDDEGRLVKLLNRLGRDSETTGFVQIARAIDPMPDSYFKYADLAGLLYQNPQLRDRLADYPMFISLTERDDFKTSSARTPSFKMRGSNTRPSGNCSTTTSSNQCGKTRRRPTWSGALSRTILMTCAPICKPVSRRNMVRKKIIGRWGFNIAATTSRLLETRPVISSREMRTLRAWVTQSYAKTAFVAGADKPAFLKNLPHMTIQPGKPPTTETATWHTTCVTHARSVAFRATK